MITRSAYDALHGEMHAVEDLHLHPRAHTQTVLKLQHISPGKGKERRNAERSHTYDAHPSLAGGKLKQPIPHIISSEISGLITIAACWLIKDMYYLITM
jgi:hypothetical protein